MDPCQKILDPSEIKTLVITINTRYLATYLNTAAAVPAVARMLPPKYM